MNFLKKIFGSKADSSDINSVKHDLKDCIQRMKDTLDEINSAELDAEANKKLYAVVKESRLRFTVKLRETLEKISVPEGDDYGSLKKLHESLIPVIESVQKGNLKYAYYLDFSFGNQMKALKTQFQAFFNHANELAGYLKSVEEKNFPKKRAEEIEKAVDELNSRVREMESRLDELSENKKSKESELKSLKKELSSFSPDAEAELSELRKEREKASLNIFSLINPANRALKKYEKAGVFDKQTEKMLLKYINDPVKAACEDNGKYLRVIINSLLKLIDSGQLDMKESSKAKVIELNSSLDSIPAYAVKIDEAEEKIKSLEDAWRTEEKKLISLKTDIKSAERSISVIGKDIEFAVKKITELKKKIETLSNEISNLNQRK